MATCKKYFRRCNILDRKPFWLHITLNNNANICTCIHSEEHDDYFNEPQIIHGHILCCNGPQHHNGHNRTGSDIAD